ncbi:MAG: PfkB family carbohydrate kinase [Candidatus Omnitrophica bacterium]|nr:PfkB family carbohydrate kinase [Candidatus Omnitrophota bacterium]
MAIVVIGTVAIDNVTTPYGRNKNAPGGSATYFSLSASYFAGVKLVAVVGDDFPGKYLNLFRKKNIDTEGLEAMPGKSFRWEGAYDKDLDGARTIATHLNLLNSFDPKIPNSYKNESVLFLANIDPELQLSVLAQTKARLVAADTMNFWIKNKPKALLKVLKKLDMLFINEHEARQLTLENNLLKAGRKIISLGAGRVIIKKGSNGSFFISENCSFSCPAFPMENVIDPTGAGDTFAGGVLGYLARENRFNDSAVKRSLAYGSVMASFAVEDYDVKSLGSQDKTAISARYKFFIKSCSF